MTEVEILAMETELNRLSDAFDERVRIVRGEHTWPCRICDESSKFKDITIYSTQWYTSPHGCTGGDYWNINDEEVVWQCGLCESVNRMLFQSWYDNKPASLPRKKIKTLEPFMRRFERSFKDRKVLNGHFCSNGFRSYNNYYMYDPAIYKELIPDFKHDLPKINKHSINPVGGDPSVIKKPNPVQLCDHTE